MVAGPFMSGNLIPVYILWLFSFQKEEYLPQQNILEGKSPILCVAQDSELVVIGLQGEALVKRKSEESEHQLIGERTTSVALDNQFIYTALIDIYLWDRKVYNHFFW